MLLIESINSATFYLIHGWVSRTHELSEHDVQKNYMYVCILLHAYVFHQIAEVGP
jgi:hypothetical protein